MARMLDPISTEWWFLAGGLALLALLAIETSELEVLHLQTRRVVGLQIKTIGVDSAIRPGR